MSELPHSSREQGYDIRIAQPFEKLFNGYPYKIQKKKKRISFDGEEEFSHDNNEELTEVYN